VPERLDKHRENSHWRERLADFEESIEKRDPRRFEFVMMACLIVGLTVLLCSAYMPTLHGFAEGKAAPKSVVAGKTVYVVNIAETDKAKAQVAKTVAKVYVAVADAQTTAISDLDGFLTEIIRLREAGSTVAQATAELGQAMPERVSTATLDYLLKVDYDSFARLRSQAVLALTKMYQDTRITGADSINAAKRTLRLGIDSWAVETSSASALANALYEVASGYVRLNWIEDQEKTLALQEAAMAQVAPILSPADKGTVVVEKGQVVTAQEMLTLRALGLTGARTGWKIWLGIFLIVLAEAVVFSRLLQRFHKGTKEVTNNMMLALVFLLLGGTVIARLLVVHPLSAYLIPVAALGMVVSVILNARSALLCVTVASINVGLLTDFNMRYTLAALLVGALSLYLVSKVTKRAALLATALVSMFLSAFTIFALEIFSEASMVDALRRCLWGFGNGFLTGVLTILLLLFLESVLNVTTPLRLLELADPAHPLLKKLLQLAPGTYNHSIMMGTLTEGAAEAIGANPNLARVGAYYHDIGKTARPEYFIENQIYVGNPHDHLSPHLSKVAIAAHVRDGERMGRMYGLPKPVVDIIKQHHGTSLLAFFYNRAKEVSKEPVSEESFRYEGEKPQSKEAAIIMLADGVEAAVRALERPTRRKIQGVIQEIIRQRVEDGQLDESALTQGDLHRISDAFDMSLVGLLGHRIQYPGHAQEAARSDGDRGHRYGSKGAQGPEGGR
jgi:putative nucleotidyltransferase with HDIG domain